MQHRHRYSVVKVANDKAVDLRWPQLIRLLQPIIVIRLTPHDNSSKAGHRSRSKPYEFEISEPNCFLCHSMNPDLKSNFTVQ